MRYLLLLIWILQPIKVHSLHYPQSSIFKTLVTPGKTIHFVYLLHEQSKFNLSLNIPFCGKESVKSVATIKWKIRGSTCLQRFGQPAWSPLDEKNLLRLDSQTFSLEVANFNSSYIGDKINCSGISRLSLGKNWITSGVLGEQEKENALTPLKEDSRLLSISDLSRGHLIAIAPVDGIYLISLSIQHSNPSSKVAITLDIKGPHGYLSKTAFPVKYTELIMLGLYVCCFTFYFIPYLIRFGMKSHLHLMFTLLVFMEVIKYASSFSNYSQVNETGYNNIGLAIVTLLFGCASDSLLRSLVLLLCCGFTETSLGGTKITECTFLGLIYCVLNIVYYCYSIWEKDSFTTEIFLLITCLYEASIFFTGYLFLSKTSETLKSRPFASGDALFFKFVTFIKISVIISFCFILGLIWSAFSSFCSVWWFFAWFRVAYWDILRFIFIMFVPIIYMEQNRKDKTTSGFFFK